MKVKLRRIEGKLKPTITLTDEPKVHNVRPSIDLLMESAAEVFGKNVVAVVLTGMGRDGASGMETVKARKGVTLVQDEETSTVFGMPKATQERIQVDRVVALQDMAREITEMICRET
jgi:two-component system chemotaxis response regulator CheB